MATKIEKGILISELVSNYPEAIPVLMNHGFHCIGCGMAGYETLEEGAAAHGYDEAETEEIVKEINKAVEDAEKAEAGRKAPGKGEAAAKTKKAADGRKAIKKGGN